MQPDPHKGRVWLQVCCMERSRNDAICCSLPGDNDEKDYSKHNVYLILLTYVLAMSGPLFVMYHLTGMDSPILCNSKEFNSTIC